jgi:hypothetical protein
MSISYGAALPCHRDRPTGDDVDAVLLREEAIWFDFEVDAGGWATRQVEPGVPS